VQDLNRLYREEPALHSLDFDPHGFEWIDCSDSQQSVLSLLRKGSASSEVILAVFNFTPVPRFGYQIGVPLKGLWEELLNSDAERYGGSGLGNLGGVEAAACPVHGRPFSLKLTLPPLGALFLKSTTKIPPCGDD
jgi:1,4-alpha-glucan branching enzyme